MGGRGEEAPPNNESSKSSDNFFGYRYICRAMMSAWHLDALLNGGSKWGLRSTAPRSFLYLFVDPLIF